MRFVLLLIVCLAHNSCEKKSSGDISIGDSESISSNISPSIKDSIEVEKVKQEILPPIDSISYLPVSTFFERLLHENGCDKYRDDILRTFDKCSYDLLDIKGDNFGKVISIAEYEIYFARLKSRIVIGSSSEHFCGEALSGPKILVLYNTKTRLAYLIVVYNFSMDSALFAMEVSVKEGDNYILLVEVMSYEAPNEEIMAKTKIEIAKDGDFQVFKVK